MDAKRALEEVSQRLELRGVDPMQVFTDRAANAAFCDVVSEVVEDQLAQEIVYGSMSNGGQFTGLLNLPGVDIDEPEACWNCGTDLGSNEAGCEYCTEEPEPGVNR